MLKKTLSLVLLLILFAQYSLAQYNNPRGRVPKNLLGLSVGGKVGATMYFGDLVDGGRAKWTVGGIRSRKWTFAKASTLAKVVENSRASPC